MLRNKKILLGICGGIAAYKCVDIASSLTKAGAVVKVIMTTAAMEFVTPLSFRTITKESVSHRMFATDTPIEHISHADWAELIVVVPATANIVGKIACGIADDLLSTTIMASTCPKLIIPAMNNMMWTNPIVVDNVQKLRSHGYIVLEPESGLLACDISTKCETAQKPTNVGRMPAVDEIIYAIQTTLHYPQNLKDKKILITAGATVEKIDMMRFLSNQSSGKMGLSLARAAYLRGAEVTVVHGKVSEKLPYYTKNISTMTAQDMYRVVIDIYKGYDIVIKCAAVSDYTPANFSPNKIKKSADMTLSLIRTKDILHDIGSMKKKPFLVGFAAESENVVENAKAKYEKKNLDMIVANHLSVAGDDNSEIHILSKKSKKVASYKGEKFTLAHQILDEVLRCL